MTVSRAPEASRVMRSDCAQSTTANTECAAANTSVSPARVGVGAVCGRACGRGGRCVAGGAAAALAWHCCSGVWVAWCLRCVVVVLLVFSLCPFSSVVVCLAGGLSAVFAVLAPAGSAASRVCVGCVACGFSASWFFLEFLISWVLRSSKTPFHFDEPSFQNSSLAVMSHPRFLRTGNLARVQSFATSSVSQHQPSHNASRGHDGSGAERVHRQVGVQPRVDSGGKGVRRDVQAVIAQLEILNCETFATMEGTYEKFREWLHSSDIGLERTGAHKVQAAKVVCAWEPADARNTAQRNLEAEQKTAGLPAAIPGGMFVTMRRASESHVEPVQTLSLSELQAKSFLEWRNAQVDDGEFLAESLADVASQQEEGALTEETTADFVREGSKAVVRMWRIRARSACRRPQTATPQVSSPCSLVGDDEPALSEQHWARNFDPAHFRNHVDWFLGDSVAQLKAVTATGQESVSPAWPVVLRYELELRKEAMKLMNMASVTIAEALAAARRSDELRTCFLITPLALGGGQRQQQETRRDGLSADKAKPRQQVSQPQPKASGTRRRRNNSARDNKRQKVARVSQEEARGTAERRRIIPACCTSGTMGRASASPFRTPRVAVPEKRASISTFVRIALGLTALTSVERTPNPVPPT